jgi:hypothetical protein
VVDPHEDEAPGVVLAGSRPFGADPGEVLDVEGDHDAALGRGELEESVVFPGIELRLFVGGPDVVTALTQPASDHAAGDVGVEEQPPGGVLTRP